MTTTNEHKRETRPRGDARRRQILDAAIELFAKRGYNAVGIAEIAANVGITQAGLLHHFPSKAELLLAVLEERLARNQAEERRYAEEGHNFLEAFARTLDNNEASPLLVQLAAVSTAEGLSETHPSHDYWVARYDQLVRRATEQLAPIIDESTLPDGVTPETLARWVLGMADGLRLQSLLDPAAPSRALLMRQFIATLSPYLRRDPHASGGPTV